MAKRYGSRHEMLQPCAIDDETLAAIGRLVRSMAEIEYIITLYVGASCKLNPSQLVILLGKTPISTRLKMAATFAQLAGPEEEARFNSVFTPAFSSMLKCRNTVAHGVLLGADSEGMLSFLTVDTDKPDEGSVIQIVVSYTPETIRQTSRMAELYVSYVEDKLRLATSREISLRKPLRPHSKAQPRKDDKQKRPPQPSQG